MVETWGGGGGEVIGLGFDGLGIEIAGEETAGIDFSGNLTEFFGGVWVEEGEVGDGAGVIAEMVAAGRTDFSA